MSRAEEQYNAIIREVADYYGEKAQLTQTVEELAELIHAIQTYIRNDRDERYIHHIGEEIGDCENMFEQLKYLLKLNFTVDVIKIQKMKRQKLRIERE